MHSCHVCLPLSNKIADNVIGTGNVILSRGDSSKYNTKYIPNLLKFGTSITILVFDILQN